MPRRRPRFRVATWVWGDDGQGNPPAVCELSGVEYVDAPTVADALSAAPLGGVDPGLERVVVDVQREGLAPEVKAGENGSWRIAVAWLAMRPLDSSDLAEQLASWAPVSLVAADDRGRLGVAVGLPGYLEGEAMLDLEEALEALLPCEDRPTVSESMETAVRRAPPDVDDLRRALVDTAAAAMTEAFPAPPREPPPALAPEGPEARELLSDVLLKLAAGAGADPVALAADLETPARDVAAALAAIHRWGLARPADTGDRVVLLHAGRQFLRRHGRVPVATLAFLSDAIDDLDAREALRRAGFVLLAEFEQAIAAGTLAAHAATVVPRAFREAVDTRLAARLHAAAAALMARLGRGAPPGCVAEELVAVHLLDLAMAQLAANDALPRRRSEEARSALTGLFALFENDDVLVMFTMAEPGDAALADAASSEPGAADQRVEAWFRPFAATVPTGHLDDEPRHRWP